MKRDSFIEELVDVAMRTFCFDSMWDSDEEPEMKYNRDTLRVQFRRVVRKHNKAQRMKDAYSPLPTP